MGAASLAGYPCPSLLPSVPRVAPCGMATLERGAVLPSRRRAIVTTRQPVVAASAQTLRRLSELVGAGRVRGAREHPRGAADGDGRGSALAAKAIRRSRVGAAWLLALAEALELDVAPLTPRGAPAVAHEPVVQPVLRAVAHQLDRVVDGRVDPRLGRPVDATLVRPPRGIDRDGNGALGHQGVHQRRVVVGRQLDRAGDADDGRVVAGLALTVARGIRVAGVAVVACHDEVFEGEGLRRALAAASAAALVGVGGTVDELLGREELERGLAIGGERGHSVGGLDRLGSREGPARAAGGLVLDGRDDALGAPVEAVGELEALGHPMLQETRCSRRSSVEQATVQPLEGVPLVRRLVRVLRETHDPRRRWDRLVVRPDRRERSLEGGLAGGLLRLRVHLAKLGGILLERELVFHLLEHFRGGDLQGTFLDHARG